VKINREIKQKELKVENLNQNNKKECEKVLFPFREKNTQRGWSIFLIILGLLIMIVKPISNIINSLGLNSFITGLLIAFAGFFYFMDLQ